MNFMSRAFSLALRELPLDCVGRGSKPSPWVRQSGMLMAMTLELAIFDDVDEADDAAAIAEGLADIDANRIISHDAMKAWLLSWGRPNELPSPKIGD